MSYKREIRDAFNKLAKKPQTIVLGNVIAIDEDKMLCDVSPLDGSADLLDVKLTNLVPVQGSACAIALFDNNPTGVVIYIEEVDKVIQPNGTSIELSTDGGAIIAAEEDKISLANDSEDLLTLLDDLLTAIQALTVPTGTGPSGIPVNAAEFAAISTRLKTLLK